MFDDYDTTPSFTTYDKVFDLVKEKDIDSILKNITEDVNTDLDNSTFRNLKNDLLNTRNGLVLFNRRRVANIGYRFCYYTSEYKVKWYLINIWNF